MTDTDTVHKRCINGGDDEDDDDDDGDTHHHHLHHHAHRDFNKASGKSIMR